MHADRQNDEEFNVGTAKIVLGIMAGFQVATALIVLIISPSAQAAVFGLIASGGWILLVIGLDAGPLLFRWRLMRVRSRRAMLLRDEWNV
jgi:hypothetical protein